MHAGLWLGMAVGNSVGVAVLGVAVVGAIDGVSLATVGIADGKRDGRAVGTTVGGPDGARLGVMVGASVGWEVVGCQAPLCSTCIDA